MPINYNNRKFRAVSNSENGEVTDELIFHYKQVDDVVTCCYKGRLIRIGHLIGKVNSEGHIEMSYHQINIHNELRTGICHSTPEKLPNGKVRLHEKWQWTSGDRRTGNSVLEEI